MARPPKKKSERKTVILRVPVTEDQKKLIMDAVNLEKTDMATWARPVLLEAARRRVEKDTKGWK
jgi:uncharacterized protein (DUF1778 family)